MSDRCPDCDAPLATEADLRADDTPRPEDDLLCWRAFNGVCRRPRVDWRARAEAAEAERGKLRDRVAYLEAETATIADDVRTAADLAPTPRAAALLDIHDRLRALAAGRNSTGSAEPKGGEGHGRLR